MSNGAQAVHSRLYRLFGPARSFPCISCAGEALDWAYQYTAGDQEVVDSRGIRYSDNLSDYKPMCRKCHMAFDREHDPSIVARLSAGAKKGDKRAAGRAGWEALKSRPDFDEYIAALRSSGGRATKGVQRVRSN